MMDFRPLTIGALGDKPKHLEIRGRMPGCEQVSALDVKPGALDEAGIVMNVHAAAPDDARLVRCIEHIRLQGLFAQPILLETDDPFEAGGSGGGI